MSAVAARAVPSPPPRARLRVAVLSRRFTPRAGGAERYAVALAEELAARHEIHVFAQVIEARAPEITYHHVPGGALRPRWLNQLWFALWTWRKTRRGFDVVHSHENTWHGQMQTIHVRPIRYGLFAGASGWRLIRRWLQAATSPRLWTYLLLERARVAQRSDRSVAVVSEWLRAEVEAAYPWLRGRTVMLPPGVVMPVAPPPREAARRALALPFAAKVVLFVANDFRRKGLGTLITALAELPADVHLIVAGHGEESAMFRELAARAGVATRTHFLGQRDDLAVCYAAADVLAHPTLEDSYAMVVLEALSYALPVVVSGPAYCGLAAQLVAGRDALLLEHPQDARALAAALKCVLGDAALHSALSTAGRAFAATQSWRALASRQEEIYLQIAHARNVEA